MGFSAPKGSQSECRGEEPHQVRPRPPVTWRAHWRYVWPRSSLSSRSYRATSVGTGRGLPTRPLTSRAMIAEAKAGRRRQPPEHGMHGEPRASLRTRTEAEMPFRGGLPTRPRVAAVSYVAEMDHYANAVRAEPNICWRIVSGPSGFQVDTPTGCLEPVVWVGKAMGVRIRHGSGAVRATSRVLRICAGWKPSLSDLAC
jgi:hypothetical protein